MSLRNLVVLAGLFFAGSGLFAQSINGIPNQVVGTTAPHVTGLTVAAEYPFTDQSGTTFADISGNGNNGTLCSSPNAPTWNGDGLLILSLITGNSQCATTPLSTFTGVLIAYTAWGNGQLSSFASTTTGTATGGTPDNTWPTLLGSTTASATGLAILGAPGSTGGTASTSMMQPSIYNQALNTHPTSCNVGTAGNHILFVIPDASTDHIILDGQECVYLAQGGSAGSVTLSTGTYVFGAAQALSTQFGGRFTLRYAEFYSTTEPTVAQAKQETARVATILAARLNITPIPVYSNTTNNQIVTIGDSLTAGYLGSAQWTSATYAPTTKTYTWLNYGLAGMWSKDVCWSAPQRFMQGFNPAGGTQYGVVWSGTNDVKNGVTALLTYYWLVCAGKQIKTAGGIPIITTMISRTTQDTNKNTLNALIRQNWQRDGFAALDDLAEIAGLGADGASATTTCFNADAIHLTGPGSGTCQNSLTGYGLVGKGVSTIINMLDGSSESSPNSATATYAMTSADRHLVVNCGSACTITLPDCSYMTGQVFKLVNATPSGTTVTLAPFSGQNLYASASSITLAPSTTTRFVDTLTGPTTGGCYWTY